MRKYIAMGVLLNSFILNQGLSQQGFEKIRQNSVNVKSLEESVNIEQDKIKIASFNIQVFGKTKRENKDVMKVLVDIIRNFDVIAIQEIRDKSETTLPYFIKKINEKEGDRYNFIESKRLGRTRSKEKYAFIYNIKRVKYLSSYLYNDKDDRFEREPFIAQFISDKFDYALVNIHIKPDDAEKEITNLVDVVKNAYFKFPNDSDVIVLGDLNADGRYFSEDINRGLRSKDFRWIISEDMNTTLGEDSNTYDRIVFLRKFTDEDYAEKCEVFLFDSKYNLPKDFAKKVSDHYPVWGLFYTGRDDD